MMDLSLQLPLPPALVLSMSPLQTLPTLEMEPEAPPVSQMHVSAQRIH